MPLLTRRSLHASLAAVGIVAATISIAAPTTAFAADTDIKINEIESSGGTPGDWVELTNTGAAPVDISGFKFLDGDDTHTKYSIPAGTIIAPGAYYLLEEAAFGFGLGTPDQARLYAADGTTIVDSYSWTPHASTTYGRCPNGTGGFITTTTPTKGAANDCSVPVKINEVESNGGTPGDWVELINTGAAPVDVSGFKFLDGDDTHTKYSIPAGTTIAAGGYYLLEEAAFGFGLGTNDAARLFAADGTTIVDSYAWGPHAATTYGRCPNGTGAFATTTASTKGAVNACTGDPVPALAWPGGAAVQNADAGSAFGGNMSGLVYEGSGSATPGTIWVARNGPGSIYRLVFNGTNWVADTSNDWGAGKLVHYADGTGEPDAEGITFAGNGPSGGLYVSTERNNSNNGVSKNAVLRFDPSTPGTSLNATTEWDLTADLPANGPNLGLEAITWIPDSFLTARGFLDESKAHTYNPAEYPSHSAGVFFIGVEATGTIYGYVLNDAGGFTKVATITSGFAGVMDLQFDRELGDLWAVCDDTCQGRTSVLHVKANGKFAVDATYERPTGMANLNNEGFAFAPLSECVGGKRPVFWSDDSATDAHAFRTGTLNCTVTPPPDVPEFPIAALPLLSAAGLLGGWMLLQRRRQLNTVLS